MISYDHILPLLDEFIYLTFNLSATTVLFFRLKVMTCQEDFSASLNKFLELKALLSSVCCMLSASKTVMRFLSDS